MATAPFWTSKPPPGTRIDPAHPLATGLIFFWTFSEQHGSATESVQRIADAQLISQGATRKSTDGGGWDFTGTQYIASASSPADDAFLGPVSIVARGLIRTGSAYRAIFTKASGSGAADNPLEFRTNNTATPALCTVRAASLNQFREFTGPAVTLNKRQTWGVTIDGAHVLSLQTFYIDGVPTNGSATGGGGNANVTGSRAPIWVGRRPDGAVQMDGEINFIAIWSRRLSTEEHIAMVANPYQVFEAPVWRRGRPAAVGDGGGVGAFQAIWIV